MIAIVDYGVGNLFSLARSLEFLGLSSRVTGDPCEIASADRIILPGVGAFGDARAKLAATGLIPVLLEQAAVGKPLLGICLGMQLLFDRSCEFGEWEGLGLMPGTVRDMKPDLPAGLKVPHIGWNTLHFTGEPPLLRYNREGDSVYFVHSFYARPGADTIATTEYGVPMTAAVQRGNVFGVQFHPEKSGAVGLAMLRAFSEI